MNDLIIEIKSAVETYGMESARTEFEARLAFLRGESANLSRDWHRLPSRASRRDWNRSQQTQWVESEGTKLGNQLDSLATQIATLENAIKRYLPKSISA